MSTRCVKVAFVINDLRRAGAQTQLVLLARGLDRARYDVSIVILKTHNDFESELRSAGVPVIALRRRSAFDLLVVYRLFRLLASLQPDIAHSFLSFANLLTVLAARWAGIRTVIVSQRSSYESTLNPFWRHVARWAHRRASHVIVNPRAATLEEIAAGFPAERISYIPNGVAVPEVPPAVDRAALGLPPGPLVACVAQFSPEKGHKDLVEAWVRVRQAIPGAVLALVGDGPLRAEVEDKAHRMGLRDSVSCLGFKHPVAPYLAADVVVLPSRTEGMPNALLEAMALGKPIVATAVGGVAELVEHGDSGWLGDPGDAAALASGLCALLSDRGLARSWGAAARERSRLRRRSRGGGHFAGAPA